MLKFIVSHYLLLIFLICIGIIIHNIKRIPKLINTVYYKNREEYSLSLNYDIKNNPGFFTMFGKMPTEYLNTCYTKENKNGKIMDLRLKDFYIASSFRPYQASGQTNDISSYKSIETVIEKGARFHFIDVWSSNSINIFDTNAEPLVRNKTYMKKYNEPLSFEKVCQLYSKKSWIGNNYPLILYLNIQDAKDNQHVLEKMAKSLLDNFKGRLVDLKYSYAKNNIGDISIKDILNKVIILTNIYPNNPKLQELNNGIIGKNNKTTGNIIVMSKEHIDYGGIKGITSNTKELVEYNKTHLGIVIPGDIYDTSNTLYPGNDLTQIPFEDPFDYGFNIVCMNYQKAGIERDNYINFFKKSSFVVKPDKYRDIPCPKPKVYKVDKRLSYKPVEMSFRGGFFQGSV